MSAQAAERLKPLLTRIRRAAQRRALLIVLLQVLPITAGTAFLVAGLAGASVALAAVIAGLAAFAYLAWSGAQRHDEPWLLRRLDLRYPEFEDSSALAVAGPATTALQALQQARVRRRIEAVLRRDDDLDFGPALPRASLRLCALVGVLMAVLAWALPDLRTLAKTASQAAATAAAESPNPLVNAEVRVEPPAYTGLAVQTLGTLDAKVPVDSRLSWRLRFAREPASAVLVFQDGSRLPLSRDGEQWQATMMLANSVLYRIELEGQPAAADERLSRLEAIPDQPPQITVRTPEKTLTVLSEQQKTWDFSFEARDDYGLGPAELTISLAQGTGEQVKVSEQTLALEGSGDRRERRYRRPLDLAALGFTRGDDLIVRLTVSDNRVPNPNQASSASFILRWPPEAASEGAGLEGLVQKTLPAYFRSQRQIIIDSEALVAQRGALPAAGFAKKSDELGVDQKVLRLRYGQFLGEGFETALENPPPEAAAAQARAVQSGAADEATPAASLKDVPSDHDEAETPSQGFGRQEDVLHEFGHAHDNAEATTLLDPETRRILKRALDEMWQAELHLRQARPEAALPYEYKALDYIKQVQQAERIYLARAGLELPQVDLSRRLSGERAGLSDRQQSLAAATLEDTPAAAIWQAIEQGRRPDVAALSVWLKAHPEASSDPLGLIAAADRLARDPECSACRADLQARLWPLLPARGTGVTARRSPDAAGAAWLDALKAGAAP